MRAFAQTDRFVSEVQARKLRPAYVFVGPKFSFANVAVKRFSNTWSRPICGTSAFLSLIWRKLIWWRCSIARARLR